MTPDLLAALDPAMLSPDARRQVADLMATLGDDIRIGPELRQRLLAAAAGPLAERKAARIAARRATREEGHA